MSHPGVPSQRHQGRIWGVLLALAAGAIVFAILIILTQGYLLAALFSIIIMLVIGSLHYLVWGRSMEQGVSGADLRMPPPANVEMPADRFNVSLDDMERAALLQLFGEMEAERGKGAVFTPRDEALFNKLRDKIRNYGA